MEPPELLAELEEIFPKHNGQTRACFDAARLGAWVQTAGQFVLCASTGRPTAWGLIPRPWPWSCPRCGLWVALRILFRGLQEYGETCGRAAFPPHVELWLKGLMVFFGQVDLSDEERQLGGMLATILGMVLANGSTASV